MVQNTKAQVYTYSNKKPSDFKVKIIEKSIEGMLLNINGIEMWCRFLGTYNALNLTAVYGATVLLGTDKDEGQKSRFSLERLSTGQISCFVDFQWFLSTADTLLHF